MITPPNSSDSLSGNVVIHNPIVEAAAPANQIQHRINFSQITQPLRHLLNYFKNKAIMAKIVIKTSITNQLLRIEKACLRLIYPAPHDYRSAEFKQYVLEIAGQKENIRREIGKMPQAFHHLPSKDLKKLDSLRSSIDRYSKFLIDMSLEMEQWEYTDLPIYEEVRLLNQEYHELLNLYNDTLRPLAPAILRQFEENNRPYLQHHLPMPAFLKNELLQDWNRIHNSFIRPLGCIRNFSAAFYAQMNSLSNQHEVGQTEVTQECERPAAFRNIGNSCYMDSAFQILFSTHYARNRLNQSNIENTIEQLNSTLSNGNLSEQELRDLQFKLREKNDTLERRQQIRNEILGLLDTPNFSSEEGLSYRDYMFSIRSGFSLSHLRELIFGSQLIYDLSFEKFHQKDIGPMMELIMTNILEMPFQLQRISKIEAMPNLTFPSSVQDTYTLQVNMKPEVLPRTMPRESSSLQEMLGEFFREENVLEGRTFDPQNGVILDPAGQNVEGLATVRASEFKTWFELKSLPELIAMQLVRFNENNTKNSRWVNLPVDGILDFTPYYTGPQDQNVSSRYEITGYAVQGGDTGGGHYVSYVKKGDKYWFCDDGGPTIREISKEEFFGNKDAYVLMLKRLDV
ncbi:MAG: hypothetical protein H0V82_02710 [Candidatus Protochlamydia sp.]|nr:hypothetical protein [Candidatus Protochlamydia sp.]